MKVTIETKPFLKAIKSALLLTKKPKVDVLKNCRLIAENNFLNIIALYFDPNVSITESDVVTCNIKLPCDVYDDGMILVNCDDLYKFVMSQKKSKEITISTSDVKDWLGYADVSAGTLKAALKQGDPMDYPDFNRFEFNVNDNGVTVQADRFIKAINRVKGCLSKDYSRPRYCNYFIDITDNNDLCLFATNSHALSVDRLPIMKVNSIVKIEKDDFGSYKYININSKSLDLVMQMFNESSYLEIYKKGDFVCITDYVSSVAVKCVTEQLNYKQIIDQNLFNYHKFYIRREDFKRSIKNVSAGANKTNIIGLKFGTEILNIYTKQDFAKYDMSDNIECESMHNFSPVTIGFDYKYLLNVIEEMDDDIYVYIEDRYSPVFFMNVDSERLVNAVMPKKL